VLLSPVPNAIQIKVEEVTQLFNTLDPFPFRDRDLDKDAEEFIVGWARELPKHQPIQIVIHVPRLETQKADVGQITEALNRYFEYRASNLSLELKALFRVGRLSLLIGLVVLALCLLLGRFFVTVLADSELGRYLSEGLIILGWVANWKPIEIFLYEWWPLAQRRNLYRELSHAHVEIRAGSLDD
jgi:hypothetical protein